ncbi:hypothetical protein IWQ61_000510 [Dispira simplex]|nr:hypothetical protein IWQ61_000510 [Dispira simplex]
MLISASGIMKYLTPLAVMLLLASNALAAPHRKCKPSLTKTPTDIYSITSTSTPTLSETLTGGPANITSSVIGETTGTLPTTTPNSDETTTTEFDEVIVTLPTTTPESDSATETLPTMVTTPTATVEKETPTTTPGGTGADLVADSEKILRLVNEERAKKGVPALKVNEDLNKVSLDHCQYMFDINKMTHSDASGDLSQRLKNANIKWSTWGENVALGQTTEEDVMESWVKSPGHYANIVSKDVNSVGIARVKNFWTQTFVNVL